jgi:hypothetical protein
MNNQNLVLFALAMSDQPLTISDLQFRCGLSYNTVKRTVLNDSRVQKHDTYPKTFTMTKPEEFDTRLITVHRTKPEEGWATWLNEIRPLLISITSVSENMTHEELDRKVDMFRSLGTSFLSLADELAWHHENPDHADDWFTYFNGEE